MEKEREILDFSAGFLWGAGTSAYQVEGGNVNDWSEWEKTISKIKAQNARLNPPNGKWPDYILGRYPSPLQEECYISGRACEHYNRFEEDFDIAKELGHNAHRFSIEWSRIEPEEGKFDEDEIEHYRRVISALCERGIEPVITLWHWTLPLWVANQGGWESKKTINDFVKYTHRIVSEFKTNVKLWVPFNEVLIYTGMGYIKGTQPPCKKSYTAALRVLRNFKKATKEVYKAIHAVDPSAQVILSHGLTYWLPHKNSVFNRMLVGFLNKVIIDSFLNSTVKNVDAIGLQYYRVSTIDFSYINRGQEQIDPNAPHSDLGWQFYPEGIYYLIKKLSKYEKPIYITENGLADASDSMRANFIKEHLKWIVRAIQDGYDVKGYFYWSFLDNMEFVEGRGFWPRFGLVEVNFKTMERKIRPSALEYKKIIENNGLEV